MKLPRIEKAKSADAGAETADTNHDATLNAKIRVLYNEGSALGRLSHPGIISLLEQGSDGILPYLVLEKVEGLSLREARGSLYLKSVLAVLKISSEVCDALTAAHRAGVIHGDISPDNIFLTKCGSSPKIKILDFGIAKFPGQDVKDNTTADGVGIGTPKYVAPEKIYSPVTYDHRVDIYSLGMIMYELITDGLPFKKGLQIQALLMAHLGKERIPIREKVPDLPKEVAYVIDRAVQSDPDQRFFDANTMKVMIDHAISCLQKAA